MRRFSPGDIQCSADEARTRGRSAIRLADMLEQLQHENNWLTLEILRISGRGHFVMPDLSAPEARASANQFQAVHREGSLVALEQQLKARADELNSVFGALQESQVAQASQLEQINAAISTIGKAQAEADQLREAISALLGICLTAAPKAFANGITDQSGNSDEGEYHASEVIDRARALLPPGSI